MGAFARELRFFLRTRSGPAAVLLLTLVAAAAVYAGLREVEDQRVAIAAVRALDAAESEALAARAPDAGTAAYQRFHATWDAPSPLAFAALGQRDLAPWLLRVRALSLESQLYDGEPANAELAVGGRFDFAFVLVYLAPLVLLVLLHDLWSREREAGRWSLLATLGGRALWRTRVLVRATAVLAALGVPLLAGAAASGADAAQASAALAIVAGTVAFWTLLLVLLVRRAASSAANAAAGAAAWFAIVLVLPAAAHLVVNAATPMPDGAQLARENREAVHSAWDLPRQATLERFYVSHPEWAHGAPLEQPFHWKWYFAFQQLGDEAVADLARDYRAGLERRERLARLVGAALPPIGLQQALHALARTDATAQLAYQDRIRAFHEALRRYYYPYLFEDRDFGVEDFARAPAYSQ